MYLFNHIILTIQVIFSILTIASILASVSLIFLPPVSSYESQSSKNEELSVFQFIFLITYQTVSFYETISLLFHSLKLVMMIPLIAYNGMSLAFIVGDVTSDLSQMYFGDAWILIVTSVFYGTNAFCRSFIHSVILQSLMSLVDQLVKVQVVVVVVLLLSFVKFLLI